MARLKPIPTSDLASVRWRCARWSTAIIIVIIVIMCKVVDGKKPEWQLVGEMGEGRSFLGSVVLDGKVYQIGGCLSEEKSTTEVNSCGNISKLAHPQVWDPDTRKFSAIPRSLSKRDSQGQAVVNDEIYVIGGFDNISNRWAV